MKDTLTSPQVVAALITSVVAIAIALLPTLTSNNNAPPPAPTMTSEPTVEVIEPTEVTESEPTVVEASSADSSTDVPTATDSPTDSPPTDVSPTETPMPTDAPPTATTVPTEPPTATPTESAPPNVLLLYDASSFTMYNQSAGTLAVDNVRFQSASGRWDTTSWGTGLAQTFPADNCLRMRDVNSASQQPPAICGALLGLQLTSGDTLFWIGVDDFDVLVDGEVIATCLIAESSCAIAVPTE